MKYLLAAVYLFVGVMLALFVRDLTDDIRTKVVQTEICPRCGHVFQRDTGKPHVAWVDWAPQAKQTNFFCRPCAPIYDEVEYAEGQYQCTPDGKTLIGGAVSRGFIRGIEVDDEGRVLTNRSVRFMIPRLIYQQ